MSLANNNRMKILREVNIKAESEQFREAAKKLGEDAVQIFNDKTQIKKLENTSSFATKPTDLLNYIKRQTGKDSKTKNWCNNGFGVELLKSLEGIIDEGGIAISDTLKIQDPGEIIEIKLMLMREFVSQLVANYEYATVRRDGRG